MYICECGKEFSEKNSYAGHCSRCKIHRGDSWKPIVPKSKELRYNKSKHSRDKVLQRIDYSNPLSIFNKRSDSSDYEDIFLKFLDFGSFDEFCYSIKEFINQFDDESTKYCKPTFICRCFNYDITKLISLEDYLGNHSTWDLSNKLGVGQTSIRRICKNLGIKLKRKNSSKIHMRLKPYIEDILGYKTESEYYININGNKYFIDEYCEDLSLCIEIDGEWCHSIDRDMKKDSDLNKLGLKVLRIPTDIDLDDLKSYIESRL